MPISDPQFIERLRTRLRAAVSPSALASALLRIDSVQAFDLVARNATAGRFGYEELRALVTAGTAEPARAAAEFDPSWLLQLARIVTLRQGGPDQVAGLACFDLVRASHGLTCFDPASLALYAQLLVLHDRDRLPELLRRIELPHSHQWAVELDAVNPFTGAGDALDGWLDRLNVVFTADGLEPVSITGPQPGRTPFERLCATPSSRVEDDSMVSVVMSAYRPGRGIFTAVDSILAQSWQNLELLIVDDASPEEFAGILDELAGYDDRVRVLTMPVNGGTYLVRNIALHQARGEFVTFQDFDDWSHPRRIEYQVSPLRADERLLATRTRAVRAFPDLTFTYPGYPPERFNASSLLLRRRPVVDLIGYFDAVRKSADVEYPERLQAAAPGSLLDLTTSPPLAICQLRHDSLSRSDAIPGWHHWSRMAYRNAFRARHARVREGTAAPYYDGDPGNRPLPLPDPSWAAQPVLADPSLHYDVVVVDDWRRSRGPRQEVIDDILAMVDDDLRVAVAHAETFDPPPNGNREGLSAPIQEMVNAGTVELVHVSQPIRAGLVLVYDPATLQFAPEVNPALKPERVAVLVEATDDDLGAGRYHPPDCVANAERLFSRRPVWVPRDPRARAMLAGHPGIAVVCEFDLTGAFDPDRLAAPVRRLGSHRPVVGRHVVDLATHWPGTADELLSVYADDDAVDVRIMGGHRTALQVLGRDELPPNWVSYGDGQVDTRTFLAQLDFFVYFPRADAGTLPGHPVLEAMASGCVVVLPPHFEPVYGDGAVYCDAGTVRETVTGLHESPADYAEQQRRGRARVVDRHGVKAFQAGLARLLGA